MASAAALQTIQAGILAGTHEAVVTSDTTDFVNGPAAIYVGVTGDVKAADSNGVAVVYKNVPQGSTLPTMVRRVYTTLTTATDMVACR